MTAIEQSGRDPRDPQLVVGAGGLLATFNLAGVLGAADVHVAKRLCTLGGETDEQVALAAALAVRGPRFGHVRIDLSDVSSTVSSDSEDGTAVENLPWPAPGEWLPKVAASPLVASGPTGGRDRPLRLIGSALYLDRYWRDEGAVAEDLISRATSPPPDVDRSVLNEGIRRLFAGGEDSVGQEFGGQSCAASTAVTHRFSVIAGGPGTGKTTTIARVMSLLHEQAVAAGRPVPLIALAAPTGKAAARMEEAVHREAETLGCADEVKQRLLGAEALTIHRLLRARPDSSSRFRHNRGNRLPHDVVIVDETSMVPLMLMARLLEAVRPDASVVLVGDPEQLASVEAGAVLGDIVGPAARAGETQAGQRPAGETPARSPVADSVVILRSNFRFGGALAALSDAIRSGKPDEAVRILDSGDPGVEWIRFDAGDNQSVSASVSASALRPVKEAIVAAGRALHEAAAAGDATAALEVLGGFRVLCAHRRGSGGVAAWTDDVQRWLADEIDGFEPDAAWYPGRPVMITANDYSLRLFNGDTGVVVAKESGGVAVAFRRGGSVVTVSPSRLAAAETVFAMTVHKSQGSEFDRVALILPPASSSLLTRELLYTAVTRARHAMMLVGSEESVTTAVVRPIARASGLTERLWGPPARA